MQLTIIIAALMALQTAPNPKTYRVAIATSELVSHCRDSDDDVMDFCSGYIFGLADGLSAGGKVCLRPGVTANQILAVVKKHLAEHPEAHDRHPSFVVGQSLSAAFPCVAVKN